MGEKNLKDRLGTDTENPRDGRTYAGSICRNSGNFSIRIQEN